ncbi:TetR/AcrR family transcriptional regulator [Streptomyces sp. GESEQ-35]|uniref:TetR/AcrR family transcriptional regulator n=1 Tax=Streptomyces sp. GESEQ-35 TaxID=2812657 RepID=UPI001B32C96A|nr:TetR/AcrR family transcriptional regulator [Streptomyces sp. GESEQ-35]
MIKASAPTGPKLTGRGAARRSELFEALVKLLTKEGFARFTLVDLAARLRCSKRTLYGLADSKEQLVRAAVVHFFRGATERVDAALAAETDPAARLSAYLHAVAAELGPLSPQFFDDVAGFGPAADVYERNTRAAAHRVEQLIDEGVEAGVFREVHVAFAADVITSVMVRIQNRQVAAATGLGDAEAYAQLAELLLHGLVR